MTIETLNRLVEQHKGAMEQIAVEASRLHDVDVNQRYGANLPYSYHLRSVASWTLRYAHEVLAREDDFLPLYFGAFFHDSIEDARLTYNNVYAIAMMHMNAEQSTMATEIVYALTNDKGRTRQERAGERYYAGICVTPYAPLVKLADRIANFSYSLLPDDGGYAAHMAEVYRKEMAHFIEAINGETNDPRCALPAGAVNYLLSL